MKMIEIKVIDAVNQCNDGLKDLGNVRLVVYKDKEHYMTFYNISKINVKQKKKELIEYFNRQ
ncbi:MAG: hypothetical protein ACOC5T_03385 [Elusimicrobiota bacterium]